MTWSRSLLAASDGALDPYLQLLNPGGQVVVQDDDGGGRPNSLIQGFVLPSAGTYTIAAISSGGRSSGRFTLSLTVSAAAAPSVTPTRTPTPTTSGQRPCGGAIVYGQTVSGRLAVGDWCDYTFTAAAGDVVTIRLDRVDVGLDPLVELWGSGGRLAFNDDGGGNGNSLIQDFGLASAGSYTIRVLSFNNQSGGRFELALARGSGGAAVITPTRTPMLAATPPACGGVIAYGQTHPGSLGVGGRCDYTFTAAAGDVVTIRLNRVDAGLDPLVELWGGGARLAFNDDNGGDRNSLIQSFGLPAAGSYTIRALSFNNQSGGRFELRLDRGGVTPVPPIGQCGGPITYGQTASGRLAVGGRCDYSFTAAAGDVVTIRLNRVDAGLDPLVELLDSRGVRLAFNDDNGGDRNSLIPSFRLPAAGSYTIRALSFNNQSGGWFELALARAAPPQPAPTIRTCANGVRYGEPVSDHLPYPSATRRCAFSGTAGEVIGIALERAAGSLEPFVELLDPTGAVVASSQGFSPDRASTWIVNYRLNRTGSYTIVARSRGGTSAGPFDLNLWQGSSCGIPLFRSAYGEITGASPRCEYTLPVNTTPVTVSLAVEGITGNLQPLLQLRGPDGRLIREAEQEIKNERLTQPGTYRIQVTGRQGTTGFFRLWRPDFRSWPKSLLPGGGAAMPQSEPLPSTLRNPDDRYEYTFTGAAGDVVTILMERTEESSLDPYLELRDPAGVTVKTDDDGGGFPNSMILGYPLESSGTYTIVAGSYNGATSGAFSLTLWR